VGNYDNARYAKKAMGFSGGTTPLPAAEAEVTDTVSSFGELIFNVEVTVEYVV
jgi:hypothetical protein